MSRLCRRLESGPPLLMDGGTGSELVRRGAALEGHPLWASAALLSEAGRGLTERVHLDYLAAGAELILANTHNASAEACRAAGADLAAVNEAAVDCGRAALRATPEGARALIAGCTMSPDRPYARTAALSVEATARAYAPQVECLDGLGLDLLIFEMLSTEADVLGAAAAARGLVTPVAAGFTCGSDGRTRGGFALADAARAWPEAELLFVQCTPWSDVERGLAELPADRCLGAYGNGGRRYEEGRGFHGIATSPTGYAEAARAWLRQGARVVGGCCDIGPEHIRAVARVLSEA